MRGTMNPNWYDKWHMPQALTMTTVRIGSGNSILL
jgi:hypothetical protein